MGFAPTDPVLAQLEHLSQGLVGRGPRREFVSTFPVPTDPPPHLMQLLRFCRPVSISKAWDSHGPGGVYWYDHRYAFGPIASEPWH